MCRERWNSIVKLRKLLQVDWRDNIGTNCEDLGHLDKARPERRDSRSQSACAFPMFFIGKESWRAKQNPSLPIAEECNQKWSQPVPYNEDAKQHELSKHS